MKKIFLSIIFSLFFVLNAHASILFFDNFDLGAGPEWGNELGDWFVNNGAYYANNPSDGTPMTYTSITSLPPLTDFNIDIDVLNLRTGGIWLRSQDNENGVILILGGGHGGYSGLYWHIFSESILNGSTPPLNPIEIPGLLGNNTHLRVEVADDTYKAFVNYSTIPATTLQTDYFSSGKVALYSAEPYAEFTPIGYDNVTVTTPPVPEPSSMLLLGMGLVGAGMLKRKKR